MDKRKQLEAVFGELAADVRLLAGIHIQEFSREVAAEALAWANSLKEDLLRWADALESKQATPSDIEFLIQGKKELLELRALRRKGLSQIRIERFRNELAGLILRRLL